MACHMCSSLAHYSQIVSILAKNYSNCISTAYIKAFTDRMSEGNSLEMHMYKLYICLHYSSQNIHCGDLHSVVFKSKKIRQDIFIIKEPNQLISLLLNTFTETTLHQNIV